MLRVELIARSQSIHHGLYSHMGKAKCGSGKTIGDARVHLRFITHIGCDKLIISPVPHDMRQIVIPRQDLKTRLTQ